MIVNNAQGGDNLEISVSKSLACIEWNKETVVSWANQYAEKYKKVEFSDETVDSVKLVCQDLSAKHKRLDEIRLEQGRAFKAPLDQFYADIKEVQKILSDIRDPLWDAVKKFEDQQRENKKNIVRKWINLAAESVGLRKDYADQVTILDSWAIKSTTKPKVMAEIEARVATLLAMQNQADQAEEMKRQRAEMAVSMCQSMSAAAGLAVPIEPQNIYGLANLTMPELPQAITAAIKKQQDAEQAAVVRERQRQEEAAAREAKRLADEEASRIKKAQAEEARAAIAAVEAGKEYVAPESQYKMTLRYFGTKAECDWLIGMLEGNGIDVLEEERVRIS